jgi:hypothetical protein
MTEYDSCLVLYIEEIDYDTQTIDNKLFITYDFENDTYVVYGKRENGLGFVSYVPYFLRCDNTRDLYDYIKCVVPRENHINFTLYNYNNMPVHCENVDFCFMETNRDANYEIVGYDNVRVNKHLRKMLRQVRNMYNYY